MRYIAYHALKSPIEEVFQKFAYIEVELWPVSVAWSDKWTVCSRVQCSGAQPTTVTVMVTSSFAATVAESFLGNPELCNDERSRDIICELANVIAGQAFDIMNAGQKPQQIGVPEWLNQSAAADMWSCVPAKTRYLLVTEEEVVGGIIISAEGNWSSSW